MKKSFFLRLMLFSGLLLHAVLAQAQPGGCSAITFTAENYQPCCYRLHLDNTSECYPSLTLQLSSGSFVSWGVSSGWQGQLISPTELLLTTNIGIIPVGASTPVGFCLPAGVNPTLTILYDYTCPLGKSCFFEIPLAGCPIVADGCISGVKYVDLNCAHLPYTNQPKLPGWTITLTNANGEVLNTAVTDASGAYSFCDLPPGNYVVKEAPQSGWTPGLPVSGQYSVTLGQSQQIERNFGNCPPCSCESMYFSLNPVPGQSDSCCYTLSMQNTAPYCFPFITVHLGTGHFANWSVLAAGWSVVPVDPQNIQVYPPSGGMIPAGFALPVKFCVVGAAQQNILVGTGWNSGAQSFDCSSEFSFSCPQPMAVCCPVGTMQGPEQVTNGDFSAGNTGFTSFFPFFPPGGPTVVGSYSVLQSNQVYAANPQWACTDHTAGTATGRMLIVDGANANGTIVWQKMVSVQQNVQYAFCAWINNLVLPTKNYADPVVQLWINGAMVATASPAEIPDKWVLLNNVWLANLTGNVFIEIRLGSIQVVGNDFAVDDISFRSCTAAAPCQVTTTVMPIDNCGHVVIHATTSGAQPATFQWCNGETGPDLELHLTPCEPFDCPLTATCADGSMATTTATVVVSDLVPPVALCNEGVGVILNANCSFPVTSAFVDGGSTDNCQIQSMSVNPTVLTGCGVYNVVLTVTDKCGNTATCTMGIQTAEDVPPQIICPQDLVVACSNAIAPAVTGTATATDNCSVPTLTYSDVVLGIVPCNPTILRTWKATDQCDNMATCVQTITVNDNVAPAIVCPPNTTVNTNPELCFFTGNLPQPTATDNCSPSFEFVCSLLTPNQSILITPQTPFPKGPNNITCYAKDDCGNTSTNCNYLLTVRDNQPPTIICPGNLTIVGTINAQGQCKAVVNGLTPTVTDNCPMVNVNYVITGATTGSGTTDASGTNFMGGLSIVTYTATDMGGLTATCSFSVTVSCASAGDFPGFRCGQAVVSCFSGFLSGNTVNPNGPVLALVDLRQNALAPLGMNWPIAATPKVYHKSDWTAANMGQIFGVTIDAQNNVYASATTMYGRYLPGTLTSAAYGNVYKINATTGAWSVFATLPQDLANPAGLGDVWFDPQNGGQLFVSNFYDGKIYRYNLAGAPQGTYDFSGTTIAPGSAGFVALGERVWAIATNGGKLYFSVWNEDRSRPYAGKNQIYSVNMTAGVPTGPATPVHNMSDILTTSLQAWSSPVSDIQFSQSGTMLVAERSMNNDFGNAYVNPANQAHASRIIELSPAGSWTNEKLFYVGNPYNPSSGPTAHHANSAGGVDYGYESFNPLGTPKPSKCDSLIWGTGDALRFPGFNTIADASALPCGGGTQDYVYGLAGMRSSGNSNNPSATNFVRKTSIYIDLDNDICTKIKTQLGDVDIFKCGCGGGSGEGSLCDSISVTSTSFNSEAQDTCCFKLTVHNQKPNAFGAIQVCSQAGVSLSTVTSLNGWSLCGFSAQMVTLCPPPQFGSPVPVGDGDFVKFCLSNYQVVPNQLVIIKYLGPAPGFVEICRDSIIYHCSQKPKCLKFTGTAVCGEAGSYTMSFCVMANQFIGFPVASFTLNPPAGVTFSPSTFSGLNIPPGGMQCNFTTNVSGPNATDGKTICFSLTAHALNAVPPMDCCTDTVMQACVTLPKCVCNHVQVEAVPVSIPGNKCCYQVNLTNNYLTTYFTGIQLTIQTAGVTFGAIGFSGAWTPTTSAQQALFEVFPAGAHIGTSASLPYFCLSGITSTLPQTILLQWLGPNKEVVCDTILTFHCPPPDETDCAVLVNPKFECDLSSPGGYNFTFQVYNNTNPAFSINKVTLSGVTGAVISPLQFTFPAVALYGTSGVLSASISGASPGDLVCFYLTVHEIGPNGNELQCCTHSQKYCFVMPPWPEQCECGPFEILYSVAHGPLWIQQCGDTLLVPSSPNLPIALLTSFQCYGTNCPPATVDWTLIGPGLNLSMSNVPATPGFSIPVTNASFAQTGWYTLTMTGHCGNKLCPCTITFYQPNGCCQSLETFLQNVQNAVTVTADNNLCKATLNIGSLPNCDQIQNIHWGDGATTVGPFVSGAMPMHTYAGNGGTFTISWTAVEYNNQLPPQPCFEKNFSTTITLECDTCQCKSFGPLSFYHTYWQTGQVPVQCDQSVTLPCLKPAQNPLFFFHGNLNCSAHTCLGDSVAWNIVQTSSGSPVASGMVDLAPLNSTSPSGHFDIKFQPGWFTAGVQYTINVTGHCGAKTCTCQVKFTFEACPCPCNQLEGDVAQGFKVLGIIPSGCQKTFMPIGLCANDVVTWTVNGVAAAGTTIGNAVKTITFTSSGLHSVCIIVVRTGPNGMCTAMHCQKVAVQCPGGPNTKFCGTDDVLTNGDFTAAGMQPGHLGFGAVLPNWTLFPNPGAGFVIVDDNTGASDAGHVILNGGKSNFAGIYQPVNLSAMTSDTFIVIEYFLRNYSGQNLPAGTALDFRLQNEPFVGSPFQVLKHELIDSDSSAWEKHSITVKMMPNPDMHFLVICLQSLDTSARSVVGIDDIEICASPTSGTAQPEELRPLRIYPNPNQGTFSVQLPESAQPGLRFRIIGLTGQLLSEESTETGAALQTVQAGDLPSGLYFLQLVIDGKVLAVEKFVKQ